jgi:hypothetical protein
MFAVGLIFLSLFAKYSVSRKSLAIGELCYLPNTEKYEDGNVANRVF